MSTKELLYESTIIQGVTTLMLVSVTVYLSIIGAPIPSELSQALFAVIGFWFGSKSQQMVVKRAQVEGK
jgi:hypothetical protein